MLGKTNQTHKRDKKDELKTNTNALCKNIERRRLKLK
jgi:hypothetical protein